MITPSHQRNDGFFAQREFTDREEFTAAFERCLAEEQSRQDYKVLVFHGLGGQGKTELLKQFLRLLNENKRKDLGYATVDFEITPNRDPISALLALRLQLAKTANIRFPAFDYAFARYHMLAYPGVDVRKRHPELFSPESELLPVLLDLTLQVASLAPVVGFFSSHTMRFAVRVREWWERRGKSVLHGIDDLLPHDLVEAMPTYFGADVFDAMFGTDQSAETARKRVVVLMDTYEALWRDHNLKSGEGSGRVDEWVRKLVAEMPGALFVICGRDALRWADNEPAWADIVEPHLMGELSDKDSEKFLRAVPIVEPDILQQIVESSKGLPLFLDLLVSVYENLRNDNKRPLPEDFLGSGNQIIDRFLQHVESGDRSALRVLCHARRFDGELFYALKQRFFQGYSGSFADLTQQSFFYSDSGEQVYLHLLMREHLRNLVANKEPELSRAILEALYRYFEERSQVGTAAEVSPDRAEALAEAAHYKEELDPAELASWLCEKLEPFDSAGHLLLAQKLYTRGIEVAGGVLGGADQSVLNLKSALAAVTSRLGDYQAAKQMHLEVLDQLRESHGEDHPDTLSSMAGVASAARMLGDLDGALTLQETILQRRIQLLGANNLSVAESWVSLGITCRGLGRLERAVECHEEALRIRRLLLGDRDEKTLSSINNLAISLGRIGRTQESLDFHLEALRLRREVLGDQHEHTLGSLSNVGMLLAWMGRHEQARTYKEEALVTRRRLHGDHYHSTTASMAALATTLRDLGLLEEARALQEECLEIRLKLYGPKHRRYLATLSSLGITLRELGHTTQALQLHQVALETRTEVLGPRHPTTLSAGKELGNTYLALGDSDAAIERHRETHKLRSEVLGADHPHTIGSLSDLALALKAAGDLLDAKELLVEVVEARSRRYGTESHVTHRSVRVLLGVLEELGEAEAALRFRREFGLFD